MYLSQSNHVPQNEIQERKKEKLLFVVIVNILSWTVIVITIQALYAILLLLRQNVESLTSITRKYS